MRLSVGDPTMPMIALFRSSLLRTPGDMVAARASGGVLAERR